MKTYLISVLAVLSISFNLNQTVPKKDHFKWAPDKDIKKQLLLTVWSFQISDPSGIREFASYAENLGFDGLDLCVTWKTFEKEKGVYDWSWLDKCLEVLSEYDLNLSLSILFWTEDMQWARNLNLQQDPEGNIVMFDETRGPGLCYNDPDNLEIISRTVKAFASHCNENFTGNIVRFHARTSCHGELEYSPIGDIDFSPVALEKFHDFLVRRFVNIEALNQAYRTDFTGWEALNSFAIMEILSRSRYDWNNFKQETIIALSRRIADSYKSVNPNIPVAIQVGSIWDYGAAARRGVFDGYLISRDVDILHIDDAPSYPHYFSIDMASSLAPDRIISMEIDGAWRFQMFPDRDVPKEYLKQAKESGESGVTLLNTANWEIPHLEEWGGSLLSKFRNEFMDAEPRQPARTDRAIFVNTADMISREPSSGLDKFLLDLHKYLSENGKQRVRFVSDGMILENPEVLEDLTDGLYLGNYKDLRLNPVIAGILARSNCRVYSKLSIPVITDPYGNKLDPYIENALLEKMENVFF